MSQGQQNTEAAAPVAVTRAAATARQTVASASAEQVPPQQQAQVSKVLQHIGVSTINELVPAGGDRPQLVDEHWDKIKRKVIEVQYAKDRVLHYGDLKALLLSDRVSETTIQSLAMRHNNSNGGLAGVMQDLLGAGYGAWKEKRDQYMQAKR